MNWLKANWKAALKVSASAILSGAATAVAASAAGGKTTDLWVVASAGAAAGLANLWVRPPAAKQ